MTIYVDPEESEESGRDLDIFAFCGVKTCGYWTTNIMLKTELNIVEANFTCQEAIPSRVDLD